MCGIMGYVGERPAQPFLIEGLKRLAYRGYDSCGIATFEDGEVAIRKVLGKVLSLESLLAEQPTQGTLGFGHTRWATHGKPSLLNAHPIRVGSSIIVHNGILENYADLKERLIVRGVSMTTETDTEIIAQLIEEGIALGNSPKESFAKALEKLEGSYAILFFCLKDPQTLYLAKKDLPLIVGRGEFGWFASSDTFAMAPFVEEIAHAPERAVVLLKKSGIQAFSQRGASLTLAFEKLLFHDMGMDKKGFKHFLLKEIFEQPRAFAATLEAYAENRLEAFSKLIPLTERSLKDLEAVYLIGCGTAFHAGMLGKMFFQEFSGIEAVSECASEFRFRGYVNPKSLGILISQSGETADTLSAMRILKDRGVPTVGVPNVLHSTLARSTPSIPTYAGPEVSVASTKAFTTQLLVMYLLALWFGLKRGNLDSEMVDVYLEKLQGVASTLDRVLNLFPSIQKIATGLLSAHHLVYLGRGPFMPLALEGALKIKEIAYVYAEGFPAGEIKHGPIALIEPGVYTIALFDACDPLQRSKMMTTMEEVLSRGGEGLLVHTGLMDHSISLPAIALPSLDLPFLQIIPMTIVLQLLAYSTAVLKGTDVDQPRNLAKSVTVE